MTAESRTSVPFDNHEYLSSQIARVKAYLEQYSAARRRPNAEEVPEPDDAALTLLMRVFGLSPFERDVLLVAAAQEMDGSFGQSCALASDDPARPFPTLGLALAVLPGAYWSAFTPAAPLRYWKLIELREGSGLMLSQYRIDERILHFLAGVVDDEERDERLAPFLEAPATGNTLFSGQPDLATSLAEAWSGEQRPILQLCGEDPVLKHALAREAGRLLRMEPLAIRAQQLPSGHAELESLLRLWDREAALTGNFLLLDCDDADTSESAHETGVRRTMDRVVSPLMMTVRRRREPRLRPMANFEAARPAVERQRVLWHAAAKQAGLPWSAGLDGVTSHFSMGAPAIQSACLAAATRLQHSPAAMDNDADAGQIVGRTLWDVCRTQAQPRLDDLAKRIDSGAGWDDLVLPKEQHQSLLDILTHVRQRTTVYEQWGFAGKTSRGLGITALFAGPSGTGKTMASEILARELHLDLYRIDLSAVVSKYIGETEKNMRRVFDAAEEGGAVLLFDEADALFGKRSEVKDSHDRYANLEVSYLLQRMEAYRGLAILTTNFRDALDPAFLRRLRFIVQFPFPELAERIRLWQSVFPAKARTEGLDPRRLARLNASGGTIRNIALSAAFLAAEDGGPITMGHLRRAALSEYAKSDKPLIDSEIKEWE
jgi:hypothetical protein